MTYDNTNSVQIVSKWLLNQIKTERTPSNNKHRIWRLTAYKNYVYNCNGRHATNRSNNITRFLLKVRVTAVVMFLAPAIRATVGLVGGIA